MAVEGLWEQIKGRAAYKTRSDYIDSRGMRVFEFSFCCSRDGEEVWYRAVTRGDCQKLAEKSIKAGAHVTAEGKSFDRGNTDPRTGVWMRRYVIFVEHLTIGEHSASYKPPDPPKKTYELNEEERVQRLERVTEHHPFRWERPGWDETAGGQQFRAWEASEGAAVMDLDGPTEVIHALDLDRTTNRSDSTAVRLRG